MAAGTRGAAAKARYVDHTERLLHLATCIALSGHGEAVAAMTTMARAFRADAALWAVHQAYQGPRGRTFLMHAAHTGNEARAAFLLAQGASASQATTLGCTALMLASEGGSLGLVRLLVGLGGAPLDAARTGGGMTALMYAASNGCLEVARFLLERGALHSVTTSNGATALTLATFRSHFQLMVLLARLGTAEGYCRLTIEASGGGQLHLVRCLVEEWGAAANAARPSDGLTALMLASALGHLEIVRFLVEHGGAAVDAARLSDGSTALTLAFERGHIPAARCLLEQGHANVNLARADGSTPLMLASALGHLDTVRFLLEPGGAAVDAARASDGSTALTLACERSHIPVARCLLGQGHANVNLARASDGRTPLMLASLAGPTGPQVELVSLLLQYHADKSARDNDGNIAKKFARSYPFCSHVRSLLA